MRYKGDMGHRGENGKARNKRFIRNTTKRKEKRGERRTENRNGRGGEEREEGERAKERRKEKSRWGRRRARGGGGEREREGCTDVSRYIYGSGNSAKATYSGGEHPDPRSLSR